MSTAIIVHGGAGTVTADREAIARAGVRAAAAAGAAILDEGGSALDAVVAAVRVLEDDPEFNAGTGSVLTRDGEVETDAGVIDGATRRVGAVAAVPDLGCAIAVARAVLDAGEHVLIAGPAALRFAAEHGIAAAPHGSLVTERQRARWLADREMPAAQLQHGNTVGAVARDRAGRFAAATSTGGIAGKRSGRVGDAPIPGAGTWADERTALSATGDGEAVLRVGLTRGIAVRIAAAGPEALRDAAIAELLELVRITGGEAGVIGVTATGVIGIQLTPTMPIAWQVGDDGGDSLGEKLIP